MYHNDLLDFFDLPQMFLTIHILLFHEQYDDSELLHIRMYIHM